MDYSGQPVLLLLLLLFPLSVFPIPKVGWFPTYKTHWAKRLITDNLYTAGRLTEEQIKFVSEVGFRSMIAMFYYEEGSNIGPEPLPSGAREPDVATRLAGLPFKHILKPGEAWKSLDTVRKFGRAYRSLPKPILFHCSSSYSASATSLLYFLNTTIHDPTNDPYVDVDEFFNQAAAMGYVFAIDVLVHIQVYVLL